VKNNPASSIQHPASRKPHTFAEINLDYLAHNLRQIRQRVAPAEIVAVVKADAYGHGAVPVARRLADEGVRYFVVARFSEAMELREAGIRQSILILGSLFPDEIQNALKLDAELTITDEKDISIIEQQARKLMVKAKVHLHVDTGMGLVGIFPQQVVPVVKQILSSSQIELKGIYSHFATADKLDQSYARHQLQLFNSVLTAIKSEGIKLPLIHMANTGAILQLPEAQFDMVRPGISLYGHYTNSKLAKNLNLKPVMSLKSSVGVLRRFPQGYSVSYGRRFTTSTETTIAVVQIGYADGLQRAFSGKGKVMIGGKLYPIVGTVAMDQIGIEVGDNPIQIGDEVLFWGESTQGSIDLVTIAERIGTIPYELICDVSKRVPRIYLP
jgi:alanine racemase